ncbi:MAG: sigma 54-interacting transcriptional regulator, partial [Myxococcota bacterium]
GKELVARALHDLSRRQDAPFVALNMGTLAPGTGAAELFGHVKGAYTGATGDSVGAFGAAQGGTIFLDEIGDANMEIQVMLLRTLETGTIQPVGGRGRTHDIDVRVIAATDAHLETAIANGGFRLPLLHRLRGYEVVVSPLRERRDDIGPLLYNFLQVELERTGASELLDRVGPPWLHPQLAEKLVLYDYPGNVRELRNFIRQMVISSHDAPHAEPPSGLDPVSPSGAARAQSSPPPLEATSREARARAPDQISDEELEAVLARHRWEPTPAARDLGISTATIYQLMDRSPRVRVARSLTAEEVVEARRVAEGDIEAMADWLRVSVRALKRRITNLAK